MGFRILMSNADQVKKNEQLEIWTLGGEMGSACKCNPYDCQQLLAILAHCQETAFIREGENVTSMSPDKW